MIDRRFGRLVVVASAVRPCYYLCLCDCGQETEARKDWLLRGAKSSCGCYRREHSRLLGEQTVIHGMSGTPEYKSWQSVKQRCLNPISKTYPGYGGRGIQVCQEWQDSFMAFYDHIGPRPSASHSIDRIDNDGNYEPGNIRWATRSQQVQNSRQVIGSVAEMARERGLNPNTVRVRMFHGQSLEQALSKPVRH